MAKDTDSLISLLQAKRRKDPKGFRKYLPDVADMLPEPRRRSISKSPFGLTERERVFHRNGLGGTLKTLEKGELAKSEAVKGLHHYAMLIRDDAFYNEVEDGDFKALVKAAVGKSPGSFRAKTTINLGEGGPIVERVSALRGVYLDLDRRETIGLRQHPSWEDERTPSVDEDCRDRVRLQVGRSLATRRLFGNAGPAWPIVIKC